MVTKCNTQGTYEHAHMNFKAQNLKLGNHLNDKEGYFIMIQFFRIGQDCTIQPHSNIRKYSGILYFVKKTERYKLKRETTTFTCCSALQQMSLVNYMQVIDVFQVSNR
jgi:hypothetical protein